jgi:hypothetical protein
VQPEIIRTDTTRTEYVPQLRILKRPKNPGPTTTTHPSHLTSYANFNGDSYIDSQKKSLAEREAEYNVARQKIFGTNTNSGDSKNGDNVITEGQNLTEITNDDKKDILLIENGSKLREKNTKPEKKIISSENSQTEGSEVIRQPKSPNYGQMSGFGRMRIIKNQKS